MSETKFAGVYQLDNGYWGYRYAIVINGNRKEVKKVRNHLGNPFKTQKQAAKARETAIIQEKAKKTFLSKKQLAKQYRKYIKSTVKKAEAEKPMRQLKNKIPYGITT